MGEKGNVAETASRLVDKGADLAQTGVDAVTGVVVGGVTGAASGMIKDRVEERIKPDDEAPSSQ
jgi:hypothetical protein